jgi:hypothetical protein
MTPHSLRSVSRARRRAIFLATLAPFAFTACTHPEISTRAAGHEITAEITGNRTMVESLPDRGVLGSEWGQVTIERARMRVEGLAWTPIPESVPVAVSIKRGRLRVTAGNVSIGRTISDQ